MPFQGSETTDVEVTAYSRGGDPVIVNKGENTFRFNGRSAEGRAPVVTRLHTTKNMGSAAGSWSVELLVPEEFIDHTRLRLEDVLVDDDWIDISISRHGKLSHVMRGLISDMRVSTSQSTETGAPARRYTLSGGDFGSIFEKTKVWYNRVASDNAQLAATNIWQGSIATGNPEELVRRIIYGFIQSLDEAGRTNWRLPSSMPGAGLDFGNTIIFGADNFSNLPERNCFSPQLMQPSGEGIWQLAQEYSDPQFCELFCDLVDPDGNVLAPDAEFLPGDSQMGVIFRDRPFPVLSQASRSASGLVENDYVSLSGAQSPFYQQSVCPVLHVRPQDIASSELSRSTRDRYNAFFISPQVLQEGGITSDVIGPLWDLDDIKQHGLRRFDVQSRYYADTSSLFTMTESQRLKLLDWYALNPYFWSGTLQMGRVFPGARIGQRLVVAPDGHDGVPVSFYIENVEHDWSRSGNPHTVLGVTRGFRGTDEDYLFALTNITSRYSRAVPA